LDEVTKHIKERTLLYVLFVEDILLLVGEPREKINEVRGLETSFRST